MRTGALLIIGLAASFFAAAVLAAEQGSVLDLAGTTWELSGIEIADEPVPGVDGVEQLLVFPEDGPNRFMLVTQCTETRVFYTPNGLGGEIVAATLMPTGDCSMAMMVNTWSLATRFAVRLGDNTLALQGEFSPSANIPEGTTHVYTRGTLTSAG